MYRNQILSLYAACERTDYCAGNAVVDGIAASNFIVQEDQGLVLDAATSERVKYLVRVRSSRCASLTYGPSPVHQLASAAV